jgi:steroid delta-isomerase-like uncharacterized protein
MVIVDATAMHLDYLDRVNHADLGRIRAMFHKDYTYTGADGVEQRGPEAGVAQVQGFVTAFPGLTLTANHRHVVGDVSIIEATARGTHTAALGPIPATGKSIEIVVCDVIEVRDGKIYREREYYDEMSLMKQLGLMPSE